MGGHSAWRKRIKNGELAKQSGGAICRHRPHLGRKGKDIEKNRKGNILGGPNKKKSKKQYDVVSTARTIDKDIHIGDQTEVSGDIHTTLFVNDGPPKTRNIRLLIMAAGFASVVTILLRFIIK